MGVGPVECMPCSDCGSTEEGHATPCGGRRLTHSLYRSAVRPAHVDQFKSSGEPSAEHSRPAAAGAPLSKGSGAFFHVSAPLQQLDLFRAPRGRSKAMTANVGFRKGG